MIKYELIFEQYPQATLVGLSEYYLPKSKWNRVVRPLDAILQFRAFELSILELIERGATQLAFTILDINKAHYTVFIPVKRLVKAKPGKKSR